MRDQQCNDDDIEWKTPEHAHISSVLSWCATTTAPVAQLPEVWPRRRVGSHVEESFLLSSSRLLRNCAAPSLPDSPPSFPRSLHDRSSAWLPPRASSDSVLPIRVYNPRSKDDHDDDDDDDDMSLITPGEGYTSSAATTFFSRRDDDVSQEKSYIFVDHSTEDQQPLPLLDINGDDYAASDDEEPLRASKMPKLKMLSTRCTTLRRDLQPFATLM